MVRYYFPLMFVLLMALGCHRQPPVSAQNDWIETQMFFGLSLPGGDRISDADWHDFVDRSITPRFPDGLTIQYGQGQYRDDEGKIHKEPSAILTLLHTAGDDEKIDDIAREYDQRFHQESVLRTDWPAKTAFISATTKP